MKKYGQTKYVLVEGLPADVWTKIFALSMSNQPSTQQWARLTLVCKQFHRLLTSRAELASCEPQKSQWIKHVSAKLQTTPNNPNLLNYLNDCAKTVQMTPAGPIGYPKSKISDAVSKEPLHQATFQKMNYIECQFLHLMEIALTIKNQEWCYDLLDTLKQQFQQNNTIKGTQKKFSTLHKNCGDNAKTKPADLFLEASVALCGAGNNKQRLEHHSDQFISSFGKCVIC